MGDKYVAIGNCVKCGECAEFYKIIGLNTTGGRREFHYRCICEKCGRFAFARNKYGYDLLKDKKWKKSKRLMKHENNFKMF